MLDVGDQAPGFELEDQNGETVSLADFAGRRVLLYFYPEAMTSGLIPTTVTPRSRNSSCRSRNRRAWVSQPGGSGTCTTSFGTSG